MGQLLDILERTQLGDRELEDGREWVLDEEKGFTVKSYFSALTQNVGPDFPASFLWNNRIPTKVSFFRPPL